MPTARELKIEAEEILASGSPQDALPLLRRVLAAAPNDIDSWYQTALAAEALGAAEEAGRLYAAVALAWARLGNPLSALVAVKRGQHLGMDTGPFFDLLLQFLCAFVHHSVQILHPQLGLAGKRPFPRQGVRHLQHFGGVKGLL